MSVATPRKLPGLLKFNRVYFIRVMYKTIVAKNITIILHM